MSVLNIIYHLLKTKITEKIIIFIIKKKRKKIPQMVYNISDWVTWGGMVLFSESILLMKIVSIEYKISFTKYEIFKKNKIFKWYTISATGSHWVERKYF